MLICVDMVKKIHNIQCTYMNDLKIKLWYKYEYIVVIDNTRTVVIVVNHLFFLAKGSLSNAKSR